MASDFERFKRAKSGLIVPAWENMSKEQRWAETLTFHRGFALNYFGDIRGQVIIDYSERMARETSYGPIGCLDVLMQIEAEFPGKLEEVYEKAKILSLSTEPATQLAVALISVISKLRDDQR